MTGRCAASPVCGTSRQSPRALPAATLAAYAGHYSAEQIGTDGSSAILEFDLVADAGQLGGQEGLPLAFYRKDYVLALEPSGADTHSRANFVRGPDGMVAWLRFGGRLFHRGAAAALRTTGKRLPLTPSTLPHPTIH